MATPAEHPLLIGGECVETGADASRRAAPPRGPAWAVREMTEERLVVLSL